MEQKTAQDAIIRALSHHERRQILDILKNNPEGAKYSAILGETGLTTSKLNYQLNELQGFITKTEEGLYQLTELGQRAINVMQSMEENLSGDLELTPIIENQRRNYVRKNLNGFFIVLMTCFAAGPLILTYFYFLESSIAPWMVALTYILCGAFIAWFNNMRKSSPKYLLGFIDWLDWKFFNGKGSDEFKGRKVFVMTVLGLIIGLLFDRGLLGLIIGSFLGAAMEYSS